MTNKIYEIRDPIHGFVSLDEWEWDIINQPAFQRLRRIKQLAFTDMVYPGATHTRFEHSIGVMHLATRMYDRIVNRSREFLKNELNLDDAGIQRNKKIVRLAALLHDIGHSPFSHAGEGLMKHSANNKPYKHEDYSVAIITYILKDVIENHNINGNYAIKAIDLSDFLSGNSSLTRGLLFWRSLVTGQFDADRADYLLRDSYHTGVTYGHYDLNRLIISLLIAEDQNTNNPTIGVDISGIHSAEALIIARYMMFTQVYFHHTRRAYDRHITEVLKQLRNNEEFPPPTSKKKSNTILKVG